MKQFIICLVIIVTTGVQYRSTPRHPASEDCPVEDTFSIIDRVKAMASSFSETTAPLLEDFRANYNLSAFLGRYSLNTPATYESSVFSGMSEASFSSYQEKVSMIQNHNRSRMLASSMPSFDRNGNINYGFYGPGAQTGMAIEHMYANPTTPNPYMPGLSYYSHFGTQEVQ